MTAPLFAQNFDSAGSLAEFSYEPNAQPITPGIPRRGLDNSIVFDGYPTSAFRWGPQFSNAAINAVLTEMGFTATTYSVELTVALPTNFNRNTLANYNAVATRPIQPPAYEYGRWSSTYTVSLLLVEAL